MASRFFLHTAVCAQRSVRIRNPFCFAGGACAFQRLAFQPQMPMTSPIKNGHAKGSGARASGSKRNSFTRRGGDSNDLPRSAAFQKHSTGFPGSSNILLTPLELASVTRAAGARTGRPGDRRATEERPLSQVRLGPSPSYKGVSEREKSDILPTMTHYGCSYGMRALAGGEKLTSSWQSQDPSTSS